ncbi:hypothetical protein ACLB2K_047667 [Fragaria x ananassa]
MGVSSFFRDDLGQFRAPFAVRAMLLLRATQTELPSIKHGLKLLQSLQVGNIGIKTACIETTKDLSNVNLELVAMGGLVDDIKVASSAIHNISIYANAPRI